MGDPLARSLSEISSTYLHKLSKRISLSRDLRQHLLFRPAPANQVKRTPKTGEISEWMCNTAREIEAATQPLSHSATLPLCQNGCRSYPATQPLCQSGCRSHSATQPLPGWLPQPLSHSATLAERLTQPLSHSATLPEWLDQPRSHSATQSALTRVLRLNLFWK